MINRILIPLDGSELSDSVIMSVRQLLLDLEGADVELLRVIQPMAHPDAEWDERPDPQRSSLTLRKESARRHLAKVQETLAGDGVECTIRVALGDPAAAILARVESFQPALVAMATHGRTGLVRWVRGSVAERVLRRCPVPLLLCNPGAAEGRPHGLRIRNILVPVDGSERSARILPLVEAFASHYDSKVQLMRVVMPPPLPSAEVSAASTLVSLPTTSAEALASLEAYAEPLREAGITVECSSPLASSPASAVLEAIDEGDIDLVAMTTHGASGLDRWLFGSVAEKVIRHCPCPLLVQREVPVSESPVQPHASSDGEESQ